MLFVVCSCLLIGGGVRRWCCNLMFVSGVRFSLIFVAWCFMFAVCVVVRCWRCCLVLFVVRCLSLFVVCVLLCDAR